MVEDILRTFQNPAEKHGYEVLSDLEERALVKKVLGTDPTEFMAQDPDIAIPSLVEQIHNSGQSAQMALEGLVKGRGITVTEQFYAVEGNEQVKMELRRLIANASEEVFIATMDFELLTAARPAPAKEKANGVRIDLITVSPETVELGEFSHYLNVRKLEGISSKEIIHQMKTILAEDVESAGWNPHQMSVVVADNAESIGVFRSTSKQGRPWALCVRNRLIVLFQKQVITAILSSIVEILKERAGTTR